MAIYVGGDTTELEYNFFTKVAGSMVECPMKFYWAKATDLLLPNDPNWHETDQNNYDKLKKQDSISAMADTTTAGEKAQLLVELDLNGLCNSLYDGNISQLKNEIKSLKVSAYARAESSNSGQILYDCKCIVWRSNDNWANSYVGRNKNSSIQEIITPNQDMTADNIVQWSKDRINNGLVYVLITSENPSDGTIASKVWIDYINITLKLNRQPDKMQPIEVELGEEWSILIKGFSPSGDSTNSEKYLFWMGNDSEAISYRYITGNIGRLGIQHNLQWSTTPNMPTFREKKFTANNYLIQYKNKVYTMYHLDSQGVRKGIFTDNIDFSAGLYKFYLAQTINGNLQGDAFFEDVQFLDRVFTDQEAEIILKDKNPNIVPNFNSSWYIHPNATVNLDGSILTLVATANYQGSSIILPILPNNRYKIEVEIEDINNLAHVAITQRCNNINISAARVFDNSGTYNGEFITQDKINTLVIACQNTGTGTFRFKNLRLKRLN
ncbi:hypothetical protein CBO05C_0657 [Clostridium botulinum B str. Osaka05]|uniref:Uncharacterized protein n=1 Tax=Clostridium botulinum B str. Osaka05 TaxID=1407017 RepID=A0A0S6U3P0_CLOBO|nr:hypothetical protein [Clostridium botulinum]GAE00967.1 hypothetical protein CBO05C_0657 [Clostridium botulinum B str. Osaka05]